MAALAYLISLGFHNPTFDDAQEILRAFRESVDCLCIEWPAGKDVHRDSGTGVVSSLGSGGKFHRFRHLHSTLAITDPFEPDTWLYRMLGERPVPTTKFSLAIPDSHQIPDRAETFLGAGTMKPLFSYK